MSIQFLGMIGHRLASETLAPVGPILDKPYIAAFARAHEEAGFDRILVGYWSDQPDGFLVAAAAGLATSRIGLLLAHRPGFVAPTLAARKLATLEHLLDGRLAVHIISGGSDADQRKDGDYLDHDQRYARSDEFIELLKRTWTSTEPFDFHGAHYRVEHAFSAIRPQQKPHIPVYFGGSSEAALKVAGKQADVFMLWGEPLAQRASAGARLGEAGFPKGKPQSVGAQRLLKAVEQGERLDERLWTGIARLVGGGHNSTALVGTAEQVADALLAYYDLGVRNILIRGFDPLADAVEYGRELIPLTRAKVAERERRRATA
ncbi:LLM class flavin-dependent oxidoreductase [Pseudomonas aeruginosa]|uniref:LLM class flavin-dependent oxidoreductase n=1 Tax=Pseudomonas aeruginosa TaxID=287 RepID=UPI00093C70FB|nr:LLM class flavin-dependent oxidoreductase [Pseudomonas aeruginosa]